MYKNRKIWILMAGVLLALFLSAFFMLSERGHYTLHTMSFSSYKNVQLSVEVTCEPQGIVELRDYSMKNGELILEFDALARGETKVNINRKFYENGDWIHEQERTFRVGSFNVIVDKTYGIGTFNGYLGVVYSFVGTLFFSCVILVWMFFDYRRKGEFCHQMIACGGVSIYFLVLSMFLLYKLLNNGVRGFGDFLFYVTNIGIYLLLALTPVMFVLSALLFFSNIWLIRHEGRRPANTLGIFFAVLWVLGTTLTVGAAVNTAFDIWNFPNGQIAKNIFIYIICYFECMFLSTVACSFLAARYVPDFDRDYIIILGCRMKKDGSLTPLLKGRVDSALRFERTQAEKTGKHAVFVPSGGQGEGEVIPESEAMARYLLEKEIPADRILQENKSTSTFENMQFSKNVIEKHGGKIGKKKIAFATTNYHIFRGYVLAQKNGFDAKGISARTKFYFFPNAFLREFVGLIVDRKWLHIGAAVLIAVFFMLYPFLFG